MVNLIKIGRNVNNTLYCGGVLLRVRFPMPMNIKRSFEILEIGLNTTEVEAGQAYKDLVAVWHPDRFSHNPRLKKKAEEKLKEANLAYETVKAFFSATGKGQARYKTGHGASGDRSRSIPPGVSKTELAAELGTGAVLTLWSYLSNKINRVWFDESVKSETREKQPPHEKKGTEGHKDS